MDLNFRVVFCCPLRCRICFAAVRGDSVQQDQPIDHTIRDLSNQPSEDLLFAMTKPAFPIRQVADTNLPSYGTGAGKDSRVSGMLWAVSSVDR